MDVDTISTIMSRDVITLLPNENLRASIMKMSQSNVSCIVVVKDTKPVGILTERDIIYLINTDIDFDAVKLEAVMRSPVIAVPEETEIPEAANLMVINCLRRLVVVNGEHSVIGIITQTDIIKNLKIDSFCSFKKVEQIMNRKIIFVEREDTLSNVITLMADNRISCVLVLEKQKPTGIITERAITKAMANNHISDDIYVIMSSPVLTTHKDITLFDATRLMDEHKIRCLTIVDHKGNATGIVTKSDIIKNLRADYIDILKRMLREKSRALIESELKYRTLVEQSLEGIVILQDGIIKFANPTLLRILNYSEHEILGKDILRYLYPDDRNLLYENLRKLHDNQLSESPLELRMAHRNEERIYMEVLLKLIQYEGRPAILVTLRNITERKKTEAELKRLIITDDLTGLFNQRYFYTQIVKEIERAKRHDRPLSLLLIDIDLFKEFNDTYGHWEGDFVLKKIGELMMENVRDIDMAFRYGGEEFTVILPETKYEDAIIVAERIRKAVSQNVFYSYTLDGQPDIVCKTVSVGITEFRREEDMKSFIKRADGALYHAKKSGRNMVVHLL
jgi:diguanylate cyclase (GGDEF)-like protein/PAS domain S-box-containing protein